MRQSVRPPSTMIYSNHSPPALKNPKMNESNDSSTSIIPNNIVMTSIPPPKMDLHDEDSEKIQIRIPKVILKASKLGKIETFESSSCASQHD